MLPITYTGFTMQTGQSKEAGCILGKLELWSFPTSPRCDFWIFRFCAGFACDISPLSPSRRFGGRHRRALPADGRRAGQGSLHLLEEDALLQTAGRLQNNMARVAQEVQAGPDMWVWTSDVVGEAERIQGRKCKRFLDMARTSQLFKMLTLLFAVTVLLLSQGTRPSNS